MAAGTGPKWPDEVIFVTDDKAQSNQRHLYSVEASQACSGKEHNHAHGQDQKRNPDATPRRERAYDLRLKSWIVRSLADVYEQSKG